MTSGTKSGRRAMGLGWGGESEIVDCMERVEANALKEDL